MNNEKAARHGETTIEVRLRFWTNGIAETKGYVKEGHCWSSGMVIIPKNDLHEIDPQKVPFNSLMEITRAIEEAMLGAGITIHTDPSRKQGLYA